MLQSVHWQLHMQATRAHIWQWIIAEVHLDLTAEAHSWKVMGTGQPEENVTCWQSQLLALTLCFWKMWTSKKVSMFLNNFGYLMSKQAVISREDNLWVWSASSSVRNERSFSEAMCQHHCCIRDISIYNVEDVFELGQVLSRPTGL